MLDRSIEFHSVIMRHPNSTKPVLPDIPEGFSIHFYEKGDEQDWADIQAAVDEFPNRDEALKCYDYYWQHMDELRNRQLFVTDDLAGKTAATATAWFTEVDHQKAGVVHALSCLPEYQSRGLGKIAAAYMMDCFYRLMPGCPVWLDTQTWSYKAIGIYMDVGFIPMKTAVFNEVPNEYDAALRVMRGKLRADKYEQFVGLAQNRNTVKTGDKQEK